MTSYIVFILTAIVGVISVLSSGISAIRLIFRRRRRNKLTRQVIQLCNELINIDAKGKSASDMDVQLQALILEMLQLQNKGQSAHQEGASNFFKRLQLLESGYVSKKSIERDLEAIIGETKEIDSGPELKSA